MAGTFALDLQRFAEKCGRKADDVVGNIVVRIAQQLDSRSPVGDATYWKSKPPQGYVGGHFRGNWQIGVGSRPTAELSRIDPSGSDTLGAIIAEIPVEAAGKVYWLSNNVPYAQALENGHSRQAPQGIVGLTVTMFQGIVREAIAEVQK